MRNERRVQPADGERGDAFLERFGRTSDDARSGVDQIGGVVDDDRRRGPRTARIGSRRPGTQEHDLGVTLCGVVWLPGLGGLQRDHRQRHVVGQFEATAELAEPAEIWFLSDLPVLRGCFSGRM